jgi:CRISPR/Cas system CMR-associated protein Cmr5 small subunit
MESSSRQEEVSVVTFGAATNYEGRAGEDAVLANVTMDDEADDDKLSVDYRCDDKLMMEDNAYENKHPMVNINEGRDEKVNKEFNAYENKHPMVNINKGRDEKVNKEFNAYENKHPMVNINEGRDEKVNKEKIDSNEEQIDTDSDESAASSDAATDNHHKCRECVSDSDSLENNPCIFCDYIPCLWDKYGAQSRAHMIMENDLMMHTQRHRCNISRELLVRMNARTYWCKYLVRGGESNFGSYVPDCVSRGMNMTRLGTLYESVEP